MLMRSPLSLLSLIIFFFTISHFPAQVEIIKDVRINELVEQHIKENEKNNGKISGYRIQVHFGVDRTKARDTKSKFLIKHPGIKAYEKYEQPNFKIRVGDFRTRIEAHRFLKEISNDFPGSFIVQDEIELPPLE